MQTLGNKPPTNRQSGPVTNPLARALAETEQSLNRPAPQQPDPLSSFSDTLSKTGGNFDFDSLNANQDSISNGGLNNDAFSQYGRDQSGNQGNIFDQQAEQARQQEEFERKQKLEMQRRKLHDQINPVNNSEVFNSREKKVKEEIDKLREELKGLAKDVQSFHKEVELTLMTEVVSPGQDGKYYITFFQKLRSFIMLLRQKIKSAATWATQLNGKASKKKKKGMMIGGAGHEKTSTVQDMMHHERSSQYSGG